MKNKFFVLLFLNFSVCSFAQIQEIQRVDSIFSKWNKTSTPGAALGIIKDGKLVYSKGYGTADLEHDVPIMDSTIFYIGSVSKQFVGICILLLEEQGKLNLDDRIQKYLPDFPEYSFPLTIRNFLNHTSGVRDNLTLWSLTGKDLLDHIDKTEMYQLICRQRELNFKPGEQFMYSNSCYFMLGLIIEKVAAEPLKEFAKKNIFEPLGMRHTFFQDDNSRIIKNRAFSYIEENEVLKNQIMRYDLVGSGGIYSNLKDLYLWDQNFYHNKLGKETGTLIEKLQTEGLLNNGKPTGTGYAFGIQNGNYRGLRTVSHGGGLAGYRSFLLRFPEQNFSVVLLGNNGAMNTDKLSYDVADIFLKNQYKDKPNESKADEKTKPEVTAKKVKKFSLNQLAGDYELRPGMVIEISVKNASLLVLQRWDHNSYTISNINENMYEMSHNPSLQFVFSDLKDDYTQVLTILQSENKIPLKRKNKIKLSDLNIEEYTGTYYSEELNISYQIFMENDHFKLKVANNAPENMIISDIDFFLYQENTIHFIRSNEKIIGFNLNSDGVRNLNFIKK